MEKITYYKIPASGGNLKMKEGTVKDLLLSLPFLLNAHIPKKRRMKGLGVIPPLKIINEILAIGIDSEGKSGGCRWEPFQINEEIFKEMVAELMADDPNYFRLISPPESVKTRADWEAWRNEYIKNAAAEALRKQESVKGKKISFIKPALNFGIICGALLGIVTAAIIKPAGGTPESIMFYPFIAFAIGFPAGFYLYYRYIKSRN